MKKENFDTLFKSISEFFGILSNPDRIKILGLIRVKEMDVNEIRTELGISQSRVSQHLKLLKLHSLVKERREGRNIYYSIKDSRVTRVVESAFQFQMMGMSAEPELIQEIHNLLHYWHF